MTADTIFDIASLTKIVATTSGMMKLFEQGRVKIDDPVTKYLPEFQGGLSPITVRDLMTHFSGLRPDLDLEPPWSGYETGIRKALADKPAGPPETKFVYSDINFILAGEIVHRLSGLPENEYVKQILFDPLGMKDTAYLPSPALKSRIAPTETQKDGGILRGVVHDPTARYMGGVPGHAGVFSTADDLGKFCQMILDGGRGPSVTPCLTWRRSQNSPLPLRRRISLFSAVSAGTSSRPIPARAGLYSRSVRSAIPVSQALRSGSIPHRAPMWSC